MYFLVFTGAQLISLTHSLPPDLVEITMSDIILPEPSANQAYFDISALHCGTLTGFESTYISPHADPKSKKAMPSLVFLLFHSQRKSFHLFDLGLRKDWKSLPPYAQQQITEMFEPCTADDDAHELLEAHDIEPGKIETIFLSHVHWYVPLAF